MGKWMDEAEQANLNRAEIIRLLEESRRVTTTTPPGSPERQGVFLALAIANTWPGGNVEVIAGLAAIAAAETARAQLALAQAQAEARA